MATADGTIRLSVEIPERLSKQLDAFLPWGVKSEVVRALLTTLIDCQLECSTHIVPELLRGNCKLVVQNLNKPVLTREGK